jgi:LysM repeat protein
VALITCAVAVYAVVDHTVLKDPASSNGNGSTQPAVPAKSTSSRSTSRKRRSYTVRSGDTLSAISIRTGVSLQTIQRLNPKIDAQTLHAGQKVRLVP